MFTRTAVTHVAVMVLLVGNVYSQEPTVFSQQPAVKPTGTIVLNMSGDLVREYAQITGAIDGDEPRVGRKISTTAIISHHLGHNKVRIEHSVQLRKEAESDRLVALTVIVDNAAIRSLVRTVFVGDFTFSDSPSDKQSGESITVSAKHLSIPSLSLADLKGVKLRS